MSTKTGAAAPQPGGDVRPVVMGIKQADREFVEEASMAGLAQVRLSELVVDAAKDTQVRQFSQSLGEQHRRLNAGLAALAEKKGLSVAGRLSESKGKVVDKLIRAEKGKIDLTYARLMVDEHKALIKVYEHASKAGSPDFKVWAEETLPVLRQDLKRAEQLVKELKSTPTG